MTIDEYIAALGIELLPTQRKFLEEMLKPENKHLIIMPPHIGRSRVKHMMDCIELILGRSEDDGIESGNI